MKSPSVIVFPHVPKTAGSTIKTGLAANYNVGENFFHLAHNGVKNNIKQLSINPYEEIINSFNSQEKIIIFGHQVDESVIPQNRNLKISLISMIREPRERNISSFYMKHRESQYDLSYQEYLKNKKDFISKFYVNRFPSLVKDPFDPLDVQAKQIFSQFKTIGILEEENSISKILSLMNVQYIEGYDRNIRSTKKDSSPAFAPESLTTSEAITKQDKVLYEQVKNKEIKFESNPINFNPRLPYLWLSKYIVHMVKYPAECIKYKEALQNKWLRKLNFEASQSREEFIIKFLNSLSVFENLHDIDESLKENIFDIIFKSKAIIQKNNWTLDKSSNEFKFIINNIFEEKFEHYEETTSVLPLRLLSSMIFKYNGLVDRKEYDKAYSCLYEAAKSYPTKMGIFKKFMRLAKLKDDKELYIKASNKFIELSD